VLSTLLVVAMVALIAAMVAEQLRQHRRLKREHGSLLDEAGGVLEEARRERDASGLPVARGRHDGHDARLDVIVDALALRKLPRLFLRAAIHRRLPVRAPVFAVRATSGSGMVENDPRLTRGVPTPVTWPEEILLRTTEDGPARVPDELLRVGRLFEDPRTASVLISPRGVRVSWEAARGDVAAWRVSRGARFGRPVPAAFARELLETAAALGDALASSPAVAARSGRAER
jgi:hypothetical protein